MLDQIQNQDAALQSVGNTLERQVQELQHEIAERKRAEEEVEALHNQLIEASRHAGNGRGRHRRPPQCRQRP